MEPLDYYLRDPAPWTRLLMKGYNHWLNIPEEKLSEIESILDAVQENMLV